MAKHKTKMRGRNAREQTLGKTHVSSWVRWSAVRRGHACTRALLGTAGLGFPALGCVPSAYQGTGVFQETGNTPLVARANVRWAECPGDASLVPESSRPREGGPTILVLVIENACTLGGTGDRSTFRAWPGQACELPLPAGTRRVQVTAVHINYLQPPIELPEGMPAADWSELELQIEGLDASTSRPMLYHFVGAAASQADPATPDVCKMLLSHGPS